MADTEIDKVSDNEVDVVADTEVDIWLSWWPTEQFEIHIWS